MFYTTPGSGWLDPLREMERMRQEMDRLFGELMPTLRREFPPMNIWAGENGVVVTAQVPGVRPDDLEITVHENTLTLKGRREPDPQAAAPDVAYHRQERSYGSFARTVALPFRVDPEKVNARFDNGILTVELPRPEADKPRRIQVKKA
ncbi:Hsp20/alpha crystallin family protein [Caldovatus aquaticus]|uniref:Hsp20/alpha crystallin family protein n=1 Tax=Caldovatus aquaticus TaxID=2865671 RepID=A0ABS7F1X8_9PROT|nr:Hsp20/alpha crystallin family protein [Caldovatus aquaticus]MBW8269622.1 Hsp20/alpha crystallin family protein [Caldovatus aquaticus]